jgi:hypothetical protein
MGFKYTVYLMTVEDVTIIRSGLISHISDNQLRITWPDLKLLGVVPVGVLLTLCIKAGGNINFLQPASLLLTNETEIENG